MSALDELIAKLQTLNREVRGLVLKNTELAALDALALVDSRITDTGVSQNGTPFEDYTPSYKAAKTKKGRYRGHVDFSLTGQMLASTTTGFERIGVTERTFSGTTARIAFDGRDDLTRKKLEGNSRKRPGFLNPSESEMKVVERAANINLERDIAEILG